jgi:hypothetical protein
MIDTPYSTRVIQPVSRILSNTRVEFTSAYAPNKIKN